MSSGHEGETAEVEKRGFFARLLRRTCVVSAVVVTAAALATVTRVASVLDSARLMRLAQQAEATGDHPRAFRLYGAIQKEEPDSSRAWTRQACLLSKMGYKDHALLVLRTGLMRAVPRRATSGGDGLCFVFDVERYGLRTTHFRGMGVVYASPARALALRPDPEAVEIERIVRDTTQPLLVRALAVACLDHDAGFRLTAGYEMTGALAMDDAPLPAPVRSCVERIEVDYRVVRTPLGRQVIPRDPQNQWYDPDSGSPSRAPVPTFTPSPSAAASPSPRSTGTPR